MTDDINNPEDYSDISGYPSTTVEFTTSAYLRGLGAICVAYGLMIASFVILSVPLAICFALLWGLQMLLGVSLETSFQFSRGLFLFPTIILLACAGSFIVPACVEIVHKVGFFLQRAHTFNPKQAVELVNRHRKERISMLPPKWRVY